MSILAILVPWPDAFLSGLALLDYDRGSALAHEVGGRRGPAKAVRVGGIVPVVVLRIQRKRPCVV